MVTDYFRKYTKAYVNKSQMTTVVVRTIWDHSLVHYGWPSKILIDQGKNIKCKLVQGLCDLAQVQKLCTIPYRPKTNGACERFNLPLISKLALHPSHVKSNWPGLGCHYDSYIQLYIVFHYGVKSILSDVWETSHSSNRH